jgi:hypothetical protein
MFVEFTEVSSARALRQGDVLESIDPEAGPWRRHLFVLTADCDLAHQKHHGRVTCVPLLSVDEYMVRFQFEKLQTGLLRRAVDEFIAAARTVSGAELSRDRVREWIAQDGAESVVQTLAQGTPDDHNVVALASAIQLLNTPAETMVAYGNLLVEAQVLLPYGPSQQNARRRVQEQITAAFASTPGDALFLSALGPGLREGYFAYLRHLEQVWEPEIALVPGSRTATYRRISRIQDRYCHALVQRFAMVFLSIGLPAEYEDARTLHSMVAGENFQ